jgi:hypothetical protein
MLRRWLAILPLVAACSGAAELRPDAAPPGPDAGAADAMPVRSGCNPIVGDDCITPFPSSFHLEPAATATGVRIAIAPDVLPRSATGIQIRPDRLNGKDGFSPSTPFLVYFAAGVDAAQLPSYPDFEGSTSAGSPVQLLEWETLARVPLFAELDANAEAGERQVLLIHPMERLLPGKRYIVALVGLRDGAGAPLLPAPFRALRDGGALGVDLAPLRARYDEIFERLDTAGVPRASLSLAWDVTTSSDDTSTGHLLAMRDEALALADAGELGFRVVSSRDTPEDAHRLRELHLALEAPAYLESTAPAALLRFDDEGQPAADGVREFDVTVVIPRCAATATRPLPIVVFGHGLFGTAAGTLAARPILEVAEEMCMILVGHDWIGLSTADVGIIAGTVLPDLNKIYVITDRLQQAHVNGLVMARLMRTAIKDHPAMAVGDRAVTDGSEMYYFGISNGGVQGGAFMALTPDVERGVLNVPGCEWSLMIYRSTQFLPLYPILDTIFPDPLDRQLLVASSQSEWDHTDPATFAPHIVRDPLPGVGPKRVILQESIGDAQVPNMATRIFARAIGLSGFGLVERVPGIPEVDGPLDSAYTQWNAHKLPLPPPGNMPAPDDNGAHGAIQDLPALREQIQLFFRPDGLAVNTCGGPCDFP